VSYSQYSPNVPRCQHIKVNPSTSPSASLGAAAKRTGFTQCGSPAPSAPLRAGCRNRFCFFHKRWHENHITIAEAKVQQVRPCLDVPVLEVEAVLRA